MAALIATSKPASQVSQAEATTQPTRAAPADASATTASVSRTADPVQQPVAEEGCGLENLTNSNA